MKLQGKHVVLITAHEFEDIEVLFPLLRFSEEGAKVTVATLPKEVHFHTRPYTPDKPITGRFGSTVPLVVAREGLRWQHLETPQLRPDVYDAVVIPGGFAPDYLRLDAQTLRFIADMHRAKKWVAAICHGPQVLISTDLNEGTDTVRGRQVTSYEAVRDDLKNAGGEFVEAPAVVSGNVITSRCPDDLPEFCLAVIGALQGRAEQGPHAPHARPRAKEVVA